MFDRPKRIVSIGKSAALEWAHAMILALRSLIFFMIVALAPIAGAELVRTVIPRSTLNYLSIPVAEVKGYFRDQGLENQAIVIPGSTAIAALVSGNVDYSGAVTDVREIL